MSVIFADIDGTIYGHGESISPQTKEKILSLKNLNVDFVLNTGNANYQKHVKLAEDLNTSYAIFSCGAGIWDVKNKKYLKTFRMDPKIGQQIVDIAIKNNCGLYYFGEHKQYLFNTSEVYDEFIFNHTGTKNFEKTGTVPEDLIKIEICHDSLFEINSLGQENANIKKCYEALVAAGLDKKVHIMYMNGTHMEIVAKGISKGSGIKWMCENVYNIDPEHVMAIGDSPNDISMFENVGYSYAMDNSPRNVKNAVKYHTCDVSQEGLYMAIIDYLHRRKIEI
ncbi:Cof-like hydrolase [Mycoplasmopsis californica]|uniref:Cof-type HAD-IIB family hydrolase n=1 Tax=Mycoplasmopsis equigenitalium TaxID=114883 RepID=A0ABY5J0Y5_9BACT|nr:Cof-type HAD-IIB family hydrolase [Mycoplasmopsis equigenitalium]UUD36913.1 Cof-type HAD-IIB family hydrolase [Mycoplasmopsis equigenitalium]VEU69792.1 Cof-like hydrolase [Mycoplasmopsis californica]